VLDLRHLEAQEMVVVWIPEEACFELVEVFDHSSKVEGTYALDEQEGLSHNRS
jgi:hypothetical protein